jgi:hypothetical protein
MIHDLFYRDLAEAMGGPDSYVRCDTCGTSREVSTPECLAHGWPSCHGSTMRLVLTTGRSRGPTPALNLPKVTEAKETPTATPKKGTTGKR